MKRFFVSLLAAATLLLFLVLYRGSEKVGLNLKHFLPSIPFANADDSDASSSEPVTGTFEIPAPTSTTKPMPAPQPGSVEGSDGDIVLGTIRRPVLRLPGPPVRPVVRDSRITALQNRLARTPTYDGYRRLAELSLQLGLYAEAAQAYRTEAAMYRKRGLVNAALIEENKAARYETQLQLYEERVPTPSENKARYTNARLEPVVGRYVGAYIDRDERLREIVRGTNFQSHRRPKEFARLIGKPHSTHYTYIAYGQSFPRRWLEMCKRDGVIPHIAWEPRSLNQVKDDSYLRGWAAGLRALNWPVFIRFAGEMNGFWTPYHGNPPLYRAKFRLVHQVLRRNAPLVATIWCVNSVPSDTIANYYPGDDGCDWVGVNIYSVPFYDNDPKRSALLDNPLILLDPVYKRYASRKPIAICEYGASHQAAVDRIIRNDFAIEKTTLVYDALPRLYPRVKMINWFDQNNLKHARAGRQLNNYSLTEQSVITNKYRALVQSPNYLEQIPDEWLPQSKQKERKISEANLPTTYFAVRTGQRLPARARLSIWVKTYVSRPKVLLAIDEALVYSAQGSGAHSLVLQNPPGAAEGKTAKTTNRPRNAITDGLSIR